MSIIVLFVYRNILIIFVKNCNSYQCDHQYNIGAVIEKYCFPNASLLRSCVPQKLLASSVNLVLDAWGGIRYVIYAASEDYKHFVKTNSCN